jgi:23S rRNA (uracil1939-C5)-methyltransferase
VAVASVESLDREGRGVARVEGKAIFIDGALTGETVEYSAYRRKPTWELANATRIVTAAGARVDPRCVHFGVCGGCVLQHADFPTQIAAKQRVLEDAFAHVGKVAPETLLPPIAGPAWGYRHRARLAVRLVAKKGGVLVGFHEKRSSFVADMRTCHVVPPHVAALLEPLRALVGGLSIAARLPQIEVAVGDAVTVLVLRILEPLSEADAAALRGFADAHGVQLWLQSKGPETAAPFHPLDAPPLAYALPEFGVTLHFRPTEFTQVNPAVNRVMVSRALRLLAPRPGERVLDLFCGLGNFSLPLAALGAEVVGIEGAAALVERARANARSNGLVAQFEQADLFAPGVALPRADKWLIDPPRDGALELVKGVGAGGPTRIVYVSCDPATLARDAGVLVHTQGYRLRAAGIVNMFPHTAHVESMAVFERG